MAAAMVAVVAVVAAVAEVDPLHWWRRQAWIVQHEFGAPTPARC